MFLRILKAETVDQPLPEQQMVWAEVYAPMRPDADGEFMTAETIRKMAHDFMRSGKLDQIDLQHNNKAVKGCYVVESFVAKDDDPTFIPGSWVVGIHIPNEDVWDMVKKGELNGFSMEAEVHMEEVEVEIEIPPVVSGETSVHKGEKGDHSHKFYVSYKEDGEFAGGHTDVQDGHRHIIKAGTVTEECQGHRHKFSSVDNVVVREVKPE